MDSAVKRRFAKRLYIGLPCDAARVQMIQSLLNDQKHDLSDDDVQYVAKLTNGECEQNLSLSSDHPLNTLQRILSLHHHLPERILFINAKITVHFFRIDLANCYCVIVRRKGFYYLIIANEMNFIVRILQVIRVRI